MQRKKDALEKRVGNVVFLLFEGWLYVMEQALIAHYDRERRFTFPKTRR